MNISLFLTIDSDKISKRNVLKIQKCKKLHLTEGSSVIIQISTAKKNGRCAKSRFEIFLFEN